MKVNLTNKQYRNLLDLVFASGRIINGVRDSEERLNEYEQLQQYIYSFAKEFGFDSLFKYSNQEKEYIFTEEYEKTDIFEYINDYDNYVFWQELAANLSRRDALIQIDKERNEDQKEASLSKEEEDRLVDLQVQLEEKYYSEFRKNGFNNVSIELEE